ncbi:MAG TPA: hypothetical protein VI365_22895 [Trebonia sp.]
MSYEPYPSGDGPGGYQPFPGGSQLPDQRGPAPKSVITAVRLMYAGAAMNAISVIVALTAIGSLRTTLKDQTNPVLSTSQVNSAVDLFIATIVIGGLIGIGLWIWMAFMNKAGKNWARITGTAFFGIDTIFLVSSFARAGVAGSRIITVIIWLIGLGAVILLWRKESTAYFKGQSQQPW